MSIPRYKPNPLWFGMPILDAKDGKFCEYRDYVKLKAQVERLTAFTTRTIIPNEELEAENARLKADVLLALTNLNDNADQSKAENARLKAEVERLTAFTTRTIIPNEELQAQVERLGEENAHLNKGIYSLSLNVVQLKDEVERLTKAGDELGEWFMDIHPSKKKWNAAKEGKQP